MNRIESNKFLTINVKKEPGDYEENGILMCGKCHFPKQIRKCLDFGQGEIDELFPIECRCEAERREAEEREEKKKKFMEKIHRMWEEDGLTERNQLKGNFSSDDRKDSAKSDVCRRYVEQWERVKAENIGLLFYGSVGTGKSFYASAIGNALLDRMVSVAATNFPRILNLLQNAKDRQALLDRMGKYQMLILDDLGVERDSAFATEQVFNVIDARARAGLPLIVTTNLTMDELEHPTSVQYARIYDRILELCPVRLKMVGESRRKGNAEARKEIARELLLG